MSNAAGQGAQRFQLAALQLVPFEPLAFADSLNKPAKDFLTGLIEPTGQFLWALEGDNLCLSLVPGPLFCREFLTKIDVFSFNKIIFYVSILDMLSLAR